MVLTKRVYKEKRKIIVYGTGTFLALLTLLTSLYVYGVEIETSGDIVCGRTCTSYFNITLSNYSLCFGGTFKGVYLEGATYELYKADMRYRRDNPERWKPYDFKPGVCLDTGKKHEFKLVGHKKTSANVKWGVKYDSQDADPYWIGSPDLEAGEAQFIGNGSISNSTFLTDGFETSLANFSVTSGGYIRTTAQKKTGSYSATLNSSKTNMYIWTGSGKLNTASCTKVYVSFWNRDDDLDANDLEFQYNRSSNIWVTIADLNEATEDTWLYRAYTTNDTIYRHPGFSLRWGDDTGTGENHWLDDVSVICESDTRNTDADKPYVTYEDVIENGWNNVLNISVKVEVSVYNNTASVSKNNANPDLWLELRNGTSDWYAIGNLSVNSPGNYTIYTNDSSVISWWNQAEENMDIRIRGRYIDAGTWDEVNYTGVWVEIDDPPEGGIEIDNCANITSAGSYFLNTSITNSATSNCINITVGDVIFDCAGFNLDGNDAADVGILVNFAVENDTANITIRNCQGISDWDTWAIYLDDVGTINITNITINSVPDGGIYAIDVDGGFINNFTISSSGATWNVGEGYTQIGIYTTSCGALNITDGFIDHFQTGIVDESNDAPHGYRDIRINDSRPYDVWTDGDSAARMSGIDFTNVNGSINNWPVYVLAGADNNNTFVTDGNWSEVMISYCSTCGIANMTHTGGGTIAIVDATSYVQNSTFIGLYVVKAEGSNNYFINSTFINSSYTYQFYLEYDWGNRYFYNNTMDNYGVNRGFFSNKYAGDVSASGNNFKTNTGNIISASSWTHLWYFYNNIFNATNNNTYFSISTSATSIYMNTTKQAGQRPLGTPGTDPLQIGGNYYTTISSGTGWSDNCPDVNTDGFCDGNYTEDVKAVDMLPYSNKYVEGPADTCDCPVSGDWVMDCADNCVITSECNMKTNNVYISGAGSVEIQAKIFNYTYWQVSGGCYAVQTG